MEYKGSRREYTTTDGWMFTERELDHLVQSMEIESSYGYSTEVRQTLDKVTKNARDAGMAACGSSCTLICSGTDLTGTTSKWGCDISATCHKVGCSEDGIAATMKFIKGLDVRSVKNDE